MVNLLLVAVCIGHAAVQSQKLQALHDDVCKVPRFCLTGSDEPTACNKTSWSQIRFEYTGDGNNCSNCTIPSTTLKNYEVVTVEGDSLPEKLKSLVENTRCHVKNATAKGDGEKEKKFDSQSKVAVGLSILTCKDKVQEDLCRITLLLLRQPEAKKGKAPPVFTKNVAIGSATGVVIGIIIGAGAIGCCIAAQRRSGSTGKSFMQSWRGRNPSNRSGSDYENRKGCAIQ